MSASVRQLEARHKALMRDSTAQRDELARQVASVAARTAGVDRRLARAAGWINGPVIAGAAALAVLLLARSGSLRALGAGVAALGGWRQARQAAARLLALRG